MQHSDTLTGLAVLKTKRPSLIGHLRIARFDHWVKNVFVLPGICLALVLDPRQLESLRLWHAIAGLAAVGFVASSNYVLNGLLDARFDRLHPSKRDRPAVTGEVSVPVAWIEWLFLFILGLAIGTRISRVFAIDLAMLWLMGLLYNVPPVRLKDIAYVDVLSEAINNPIRFLAGWHLTGTPMRPITSVLITYWMAGCYFMAIKRYAELSAFGTTGVGEQYRKSYARYTPERLLVSILFYGSLAMLFFGAYMGRYRLEMAVTFPFVALVMAVYLALAFKPDSAAQRPELLIWEPALMLAVAACAVVMALMLFVDLPWLHEVFIPSIPPRP